MVRVLVRRRGPASIIHTRHLVFPDKVFSSPLAEVDMLVHSFWIARGVNLNCVLTTIDRVVLPARVAFDLIPYYRLVLIPLFGRKRVTICILPCLAMIPLVASATVVIFSNKIAGTIRATVT